MSGFPESERRVPGRGSHRKEGQEGSKCMTSLRLVEAVADTRAQDWQKGAKEHRSSQASLNAGRSVKRQKFRPEREKV